MLPVYNCIGCGACCTEVGRPPFDGNEADHLPEPLRREVRDCARLEGNCLWLNRSTMTCKHYNHRPKVCREFEIGGRECGAFRQRVGATF